MHDHPQHTGSALAVFNFACNTQHSTNNKQTTNYTHCNHKTLIATSGCPTVGDISSNYIPSSQVSLGYHSRIEQHVSRIQPPAKLSRDQLQYQPVGTQCRMEQKVHGPCSRPKPAAAMGCLGTLHLPEGFQIQGRPGRSNPTNGERNTTAPTSKPT